MARYDPKGNSRDRSIDAVRFEEAAPPDHLRGVVHRFLELSTDGVLAQDYRFHALPDACSYLIFDHANAAIAGVTKLKASSEELNLGKQFHFTNIRFLPGVWQTALHPVAYGLVEQAYTGALPLPKIASQLIGKPFEAQQAVLIGFVETLIAQGLLIANPVTQAIFAHMDDIFTVADMAEIVELSPRQLQRVLKSTTGFTPHDFLKILRLQQSLAGEPSLGYADQSHFIHSFRKATGYTPGQFSKKFDV